jgi:hypothetical protein
MNFKLLKILVVATTTLLVSMVANATCTYDPTWKPAEQIYSTNPGRIYVPRDAPIGYALYSKEVLNTEWRKIMYRDSANLWRESTHKGSLVSNNVYSTGSDGVGYKVYYSGWFPRQESGMSERVTRERQVGRVAR